MTNGALVTPTAMRLRSGNKLPQAGTGANRDGESRPISGSPTYSGGDVVSQRSVQSRTAADSNDEVLTYSSPSSSINSLFQSPSSSPQSFMNTPRSSSSLSLTSADVVQEAVANKPAPITDSTRTRKKWTDEMNRFIWRTYLITSKLESLNRGYLEPLHRQFQAKYPNIDASRQRIGDQRRAIINNKLLSQRTLDEIRTEVEEYLNNDNPTIDTHSVNTHSNSSQRLDTSVRPTTGERMAWPTEINEMIMRFYYIVTEGETNLTAYRKKLHEKFTYHFTHLSHLSEQRIADQRRVIVYNKLISTERLQAIKDQVEEEQRLLNTNTTNDSQTETIEEYTDHIINIDTHNSFEILVEEQDHEETILENSQTQNTQLHTGQRRLNNQYRRIINNRDVNAQEIESHFKTNLEKFINTNPTKRPYIPKLKVTRKLTSIVDFLDNTVIPKHIYPEQDYTSLQTIIYVAAYTTANLVGAKINQTTRTVNEPHPNKPYWQKRMESKILRYRADIGRLTQYIRGNRNRKIVMAVETIKSKFQTHARYENPNTEPEHFLDTLKQKLNTTSNRLKRYLACTARKTQNTQFINNESGFYRKLSSNNNITNAQTRNAEFPPIDSIRQFWAELWETPVQHNQYAPWINNNNTSHIPTMEFEHISIDTFIQVIKRTHNWKSPGTDHIQNYWYKKLTCTHSFIYQHLNKFIETPETMPSYITEGLTYMIPKDNDTTNPSKYRPITCLQTIYKILTACLSETIYSHLTQHNVLKEQQKGCRKHSQGCKEQLTIDAVAMKQASRRKRNIHSMYVDYRKAFDSVPHSWLLFILNHYKIHPTIVNFLETTMNTWQTSLTIRRDGISISSEPIRIRRGIYQGDALSPLWFCLALNPLSELLDETNVGFRLKHDNTQHILSHLMYVDDIKLYADSKTELFRLADVTQEFSTDICMQFGIDKCKIHSIYKGKIQSNNYILNTGEQIDPMAEGDSYKYLGFQQSRQIHQKQTKQDLTKKFRHRLNIILKSHLNSRNTVKAINTFAIPVLTYSFGIINWSQTDLKKFQRTINTHLTKHRKHHPKSAVQRLMLPRSEGGRGIIDIQNLHNQQITTLRKYFHNKADNSSLHKYITQIDDHYTPLNLKNKNTQPNESTTNIQQKKNEWAQKALHGRHYADLNQGQIDKTASNSWLKRGELFPETEGFMIAIQDQVIATRNYRKHIMKEIGQQTDLCRHCNSASETIQHITGACKSIVQTDYKHRHDQVASIIHQYLAHKYKFIKEKVPYYKYIPSTIHENNNYKLYWDRTIITDRTIHFNRPDITFHDKNNQTVYLIDIAIPNTHNMISTISDKLAKYQDLAIELKSQWRANTVHIVPVVMSTTGVIPKSLTQSLNTLQISTHIINLLQKATILNTCRITRKFLTASTISSNSTFN